MQFLLYLCWCAYGSPHPQGRKNVCLAISEPYAGSDVSGIRTTAERDGDEFVIKCDPPATHTRTFLHADASMNTHAKHSGSKKWITGGTMADYFVVAVRAGMFIPPSAR